MEEAGNGLAVPAPETLCVGDQPDVLSAVLHDTLYCVQMGKNSIYLVCLAVSLHLEKTVAGGADEHVAVLALQQTGDVAGHLSFLFVIGGHCTEALTVEDL